MVPAAHIINYPCKVTECQTPLPGSHVSHLLDSGKNARTQFCPKQGVRIESAEGHSLPEKRNIFSVGEDVSDHSWQLFMNNATGTLRN
ncbi:hypothetical protein TNIN_409881 [Trichonephila inaurata madagascariensis]|uniref:Uncharacterized protein n=1 Tax=Trichonephila inaurata madagascariensis TaxID=2747483 RepID=A0A8X7CES5_9ARAC|nr:hypothetical protein TNIN_409881 [Trichonephila inaurata madagascariensis]